MTEPYITTTWQRIGRALGMVGADLRREWEAEKAGGSLRRLIRFGGPQGRTPFVVTTELKKLAEARGVKAPSPKRRSLRSWEEVARYLGVSGDTVKAWFKAGQLKHCVEYGEGGMAVNIAKLQETLAKASQKPKRRRVVRS